MQLALNIADTDSQQAAQLAKSSEMTTINTMMPTLLMAISRKNVASANDLFNYALSVAAKDLSNLAGNVDQLSYYVLPGYGNPAIRYNYGLFDSAQAIAQVDPSIINSLLSFAYKSLAAMNAAQVDVAGSQSSQEKDAQDYYVWQNLMPYFDKYLPTGSPTVQAHLDQLLSRIPAGTMRDGLVNGNGMQETLTRADSTDDPRMKSLLYTNAAMQAMGDGDYDKAMTIAEKITNTGQRTGVLSMVSSLAALDAIDKGDFDTANHYIEKLSKPIQRASLFISMSQALQKKNDTVRAREVLEDAERLMEKADEGPEKAAYLLRIANAMISIDANRGFEMMKSAIDSINKIKTGDGPGNSITGLVRHTDLRQRLSDACTDRF